MKTNSLFPLLAAAFCFVVLNRAGCAEKETPTGATPPADNAPLPAPAGVQWSDIKDRTFDQRDLFFAGLKHLEARVDEQITELTAKRATMKGITDTKEWDFAMKEMVNARSALRSTGEVLAKAGRETWDEEKDRVGQAWVRTQDAFAKVKSSTTS
jgi:hypothetical protein